MVLLFHLPNGKIAELVSMHEQAHLANVSSGTVPEVLLAFIRLAAIDKFGHNLVDGE